MSKIEILFGEYANLYGDMGNIKYMEQASNNIDIINTGLKEKPKFLTEHVDLVYLGPMTESAQEKIIEILKKYKKQIKDKIEDGQFFLAVGNALEIFGDYIERTDGTKIEALGFFDIYAKRIERFRHNDLIMGKDIQDGYKIVGFKNQMSHIYGVDNNYFLDLEFGCGRNRDDNMEGIHYNNFIGTYVIGPILPLNPEFASKLMRDIGLDEDETKFKKLAIEAHAYREKEYEGFKGNK